MKKYLWIIMCIILLVSCQPENLPISVEYNNVELDNNVEIDDNVELDDNVIENHEMVASNTFNENNEVVTEEDEEPELIVIHESYITSMDSGFDYYIKYLNEETQASEDTYSRVQIFIVEQEKNRLLYDTNDFQKSFYYVRGNINDQSVINILDQDRDGIDEIYIRIETIENIALLVIKNVEGQYQDVITKIGYNIPAYIDIDEDGIPEMITPHPGGGGYVSYWVGLDLINQWVNDKYVFSFNLTELYYDQKISLAEENYKKDQSVQNYVTLIDLYGITGKLYKLNEVIEENKPLFEDRLDEFKNYNEHAEEIFTDYYQGTTNTKEFYYGYINYRARSYKDVWANILTWDTNGVWHTTHESGYLLELTALEQYGDLYHVIIYRMIDGKKIFVLDSADYDVVLDQYYLDYDYEIAIEDRDLDGLDEIYIKSSPEQSGYITVFKLIDGYYQIVFSGGANSSTTDYVDVNGDGN